MKTASAALSKFCDTFLVHGYEVEVGGGVLKYYSRFDQN